MSPEASDPTAGFYRDEVAPVLPPAVLDFHTHVWSTRNWSAVPWQTDRSGGKYMVTTEDYSAEQLLADGKRCFPDREYRAVCFGAPTPVVRWEDDWRFVADAARRHSQLFPLVLGGPSLNIARDRYEAVLREGGFYGFKVMLNWIGDNYGNIRVEEMFGPAEIDAANAHRLVVLLHVPRAGRLADPEVQRGVQWLAGECPHASIVLAHCGRCYMPAEMKRAVGSIRSLANVWMDTSMVMDPIVLQMAMETIGPSRLLFATDFPVAAMRGRRVRVMDHWVDIVVDGPSDSAYRVFASNIRATYMAVEIAVAIRQAAERAGVSGDDLRRIFHDNGQALLDRVKRA